MADDIITLSLRIHSMIDTIKKSRAYGFFANLYYAHAWVYLLVFGSLTRFLYFGYPKEVVFDEVHFGKFISGYLTHQYFFDIHPPLAKLLISFMGFLGGFHPTLSFAEIGQHFPDRTYLWLRLLPALAGAVLPLVIYFLSHQLRLSKTAAFVAGLLVVFENSLLTQSHYILLDSLLLLFGFSGVLFYFLARQKKSFWLLILAIVSLTFAFSVKWTGLSFLGLCGMLEIYNSVRERRNWKKWLQSLALFSLIPICLYMLIFQIHFLLLKKSGPGDAFMSQAFQSTLVGNEKIQVTTHPSFLQKFFELNKVMYTANQNLKTHSYGSKWWSWPLMLRPIYYWNGKDASGESAKIYLLGNPVIYWGVFISLYVLIFSLVLSWRKMKPKVGSAAFLLLGYCMNLLPFIFIGRVMFLYHYFTALIFGIMLLAFVVDTVEDRVVARKLFLGIVFLSFISFVFFAPLSYGLSLSPKAEAMRFWLPSWR